MGVDRDVRVLFWWLVFVEFAWYWADVLCMRLLSCHFTLYLSPSAALDPSYSCSLLCWHLGEEWFEGLFTTVRGDKGWR